MDIFESKNIKPMLISEMTEPFNNPDWIYELKLDGIRCVAYLDRHTMETELRNKRNLRLLPKVPELTDICLNIKERCILDGELVILKNGVPDFFELQRRVLTSNPFKIQISSDKYPASFVAYDILYLKDRELIDLPLLERKAILSDTVIETPRLAVSRYIPEKGIELFEVAKSKNLEGVIAKKNDSRYYFERGITSLVLGQYQGSDLIYQGHVTMGVRLGSLRDLEVIPHSPFAVTPSGHENAVWVKPTLVCVVKYMPNEKGMLRQPVLKGFRDDKEPIDCQLDT
jgi:bifunctional non-homologous end joining protein LigD